MSYKGRLFMTLVLCGMLLYSGSAYASKTTDLMSSALKQRSSGNINAAITSFKQAVDGAPTILQRNLALFMLGDCQMEVSKYSDAVTTFTELSQKGTTADERAEALYKLMEANSNLGNSDKVKEAYGELKKKYSRSAYFEIAKAFMQAEDIMDSEYTGPIVVDEPKTNSEVNADSKKTTVAAKPANNAKTAVSPKTSENKQETVAKTQKSKPAKQNVASKSQKIAANSKPTGKKLDAQTTAILEEILYIEPLSDAQRDELVSKILGYQDKLKDGEKGTGKDKVLFELAGATAKFGELLEACKTYDKILSYHPASSLAEQAYYQAIRLRAMLGVHQTVVEWARAFNITFPNSAYKKQVAALVAYSQAGGKVQMNPTGKVAAKTGSATASAKSSKKSGDNQGAVAGDIDSVNAALKASTMYQSAVNKMNDGNYQSALGDLKVLAGTFPGSSQLWWDTTLVYVQLEEFRSADKTIRKMLQLDPENSDANSLLGYIQYRLENYEEAASAYENAGEAEGEGVTFFDAKSASERMKKNAGH